ncbi:hypothetical protein GIB67_035917 [Kingdonia uniflora]|uniref:NADP-dependent oxidoreductase domain-containing protein n=1 Tax=Kingdonia uniflora TaxID=39325 RepID=A0A7J7N0Q6_9MAGN|nr:hypothetical protein GIB67_035917 [Kingdonia uniflora]
MKGKGGAAGNYFVLNTGAKIPAIGLGTWQSGGDLCIEAVKTALDAGYRHFDCSHLYGNEVEVGEALSEAFESGGINREDVFLTSKLYCTTNSSKRIENTVRVSFKNLGVSYLDLYLVHWPESFAFSDATDPPWKSASEYRQFSNRLKPTWKAMEALVESGLVRAIGVSNFSVRQIEELLQFANIVPAVNQPVFCREGALNSSPSNKAMFKDNQWILANLEPFNLLLSLSKKLNSQAHCVSTICIELPYLHSYC